MRGSETSSLTCWPRWRVLPWWPELDRHWLDARRYPIGRHSNAGLTARLTGMSRKNARIAVFDGRPKRGPVATAIATADRPSKKAQRRQPKCDMLRIGVHGFLLRAEHAEAFPGLRL